MSLRDLSLEVTRSLDSRNRARSRISSKSQLSYCRDRTNHVHRGPPNDVPALSYQSLLTFAMFIKEETAESLALRLGVPGSIVDKLKDRLINQVYEVREPTVLRTFHILWIWRGRSASHSKVEEMLDALRDIGKWELAAVVHNAHKERRRISATDFAL